MPCHAMPRALAPVRVLGQVGNPAPALFRGSRDQLSGPGSQTQMFLEGVYARTVPGISFLSLNTDGEAPHYEFLGTRSVT